MMCCSFNDHWLHHTGNWKKLPFYCAVCYLMEKNWRWIIWIWNWGVVRSMISDHITLAIWKTTVLLCNLLFDGEKLKMNHLRLEAMCYSFNDLWLHHTGNWKKLPFYCAVRYLMEKNWRWSFGFGNDVLFIQWSLTTEKTTVLLLFGGEELKENHLDLKMRCCSFNDLWPRHTGNWKNYYSIVQPAIWWRRIEGEPFGLWSDVLFEYSWLTTRVLLRIWENAVSVSRSILCINNLTCAFHNCQPTHVSRPLFLRVPTPTVKTEEDGNRNTEIALPSRRQDTAVALPELPTRCLLSDHNLTATTAHQR